ncbi:MAG: DUF4430 domain-containing protein [Actinomycetota bacterium]
MTAHHRWVVAIGLLCSVAPAGCGLGAGPSIGEVGLTVTRDYGSQRLLQRSDPDAPESETAMRLLDRNAEISTRYGGRFVESVNGIESGRPGGRSHDWFFYVNGVESPVGAADYELHGGDRVWWDYRDWTEAMRVPAVVGSFPEPFLHGYEGSSRPAELHCLGAGTACGVVRDRLGEEGIGLADGAPDPIRIVVGPWARLRGDEAADLIEQGPQVSGVFADFESSRGNYALELFDAEGDTRSRMRSGAGLVAATRYGEDPPTWIVTGTDPAGVAAAAHALNSSALHDRYAIVAVSPQVTFPSAPIPVPLP